MRIKQAITQSIELKQELLKNEFVLNQIQEIANKMVEILTAGGSVYFCGNGGSAADAQHLAAELSGRFYFDREPLSSEALHVNTSYLTAVANDYSYDEIYSRMVRAKAKAGDMIVGISTSGNSGNVVRAFETAKNQNVYTVAMTGQGGGKMKEQADYLLEVPSKDTPRIQESHIMLGHIICELVETQMFKNETNA